MLMQLDQLAMSKKGVLVTDAGNEKMHKHLRLTGNLTVNRKHPTS
jgi:hypothetical protein